MPTGSPYEQEMALHSHQYLVESVSMERVDRGLLECPSMIDNNMFPKGGAQSYLYTVESQGSNSPATDSLSHGVAG